MENFNHPKYMFFENRLAAEKYLANEINDLISKKPNSILSIESTNEFLNLFSLMGQKSLETQTSYQNTMLISPYEYCPSDFENYNLLSYNFLSTNLLSQVDIDPNNYFCIFDSNTIQTPHTDLSGFDAYLNEQGNIDITLINLASDGTILLNFIGTQIDSKSRTIEINPEFQNFANLGPFTPTSCAATLGIESIAKSKHIFITAFGAEKTHMLSNFFFDDGFNSTYPVTALRDNPNVTIIADMDAARTILEKSEKSANI